MHDDEEGAGEGRHGAVCVMAMHAAQGREYRHVFVLGLQSARMPGARRRLAEPIPDALLHEELAADTRSEHVADMRRLAHVAMTRSRGVPQADRAAVDRHRTVQAGHEVDPDDRYRARLGQA